MKRKSMLYQGQWKGCSARWVGGVGGWWCKKSSKGHLHKSLHQIFNLSPSRTEYIFPIPINNVTNTIESFGKKLLVGVS